MLVPLKLWIINEFSLFWFHPYSAAFGLWLDLSYVCLLQRRYWSYQYEYSDSGIRIMTIVQHLQGWCAKRIRFWAGRVENKVLDYGSVTKVNTTFLGYLQFASGPNAAFHCSPSFKSLQILLNVSQSQSGKEAETRKMLIFERKYHV